MDFTTSIKTCLTKKYASFSGRASRSEFWFFYLFLLIGYIMGITIVLTVSFVLYWIMGVFMMAMIIPALAVTARRLHDINRSGWWQLLWLGVLSGIVLLWWAAQPSHEGTNKYDPDL